MIWKECIASGMVRRRTKDLELARSLLNTAKDRIEAYAKEMVITEKNARFVFEEYYEAILELLHALIALEGYKSYNHECAIEFLREFYGSIFNDSEIELLHRLRRIRNSIKYYGALMSKKEVEELLRDGGLIFNKILDFVEAEMR